MATITKALVCKLKCDDVAYNKLLHTADAYSQACAFVATKARELRTHNKVVLHHATYYTVRKRFGLPAQLACTCRDKVAEAVKAVKSQKSKRASFPAFSKQIAIRYDARTCSFHNELASLSTNDGRIKATIAGAPEPLWSEWKAGQWKVGSCDLILKGKAFYLHIVLSRETEVDHTAPKTPVGVDVGLNNVAVTSAGNRVRFFSGKQVGHLRGQHLHKRQELQRKGTRAAKRLLKSRKQREHRLMRHTNHVVSKQVVEFASRQVKPVIVMENLRYIRDRIRAQRKQRSRLHGWSFDQLQAFIAYKAQAAGIPVAYVDPRNTSRTCPRCGNCDKAQRNGLRFACLNCGLRLNADHVGSLNIAGRYMLPAMAACKPAAFANAPLG